MNKMRRIVEVGALLQPIAPLNNHGGYRYRADGAQSLTYQGFRPSKMTLQNGEGMQC